MSDAKNDAKGERRISEVPGKEVKGPEERRGNWFREMAQRLGPLVAGAFLAMAPMNVGCGSANSDTAEDDGGADVQEEDARPDEGQDDAATPEDVQVDEEEDGAVEESANPDIPEADVAEEDVSSPDGEDARDAEEVPEAVDAPDVAEGTDVPPEADVPVCEPVTHMEEGAPEPAGTICGSTREKVVTIAVTEYGEGCEFAGTVRSLESVEYRINPPLDYTGERDPMGGLVCARGNETELLNPGVFMVIEFSPIEIQAGYKLASALNMYASSPPLNGGTYQLQLRYLNGTIEVNNRLLDAAGTYYGERVDVPGQGRGGFVAIDPNNGAFAWDLTDDIYASQAIIRLESGNPVVIGNPGSIYYEVPGDEGWFNTSILTGSSYWEITGYRFERDHYKK